ncbi:hypothetical protein ACGP04_15155 [Piscirickettsia salmonis]|uniref:hypothetical protein n=1 Tax=Piscirickettsia salmonis TaxID=1238 RepID=UPI000F08C82A|nr:hypothetical protein DA717_07790 [Piscirickettsiaceae bacterium NZ-RLO2]
MGRLFNKENPADLKSSGYFSIEPKGKSSGWRAGNVAWIEYSLASLGDSPLFFAFTILMFCASVPYICVASLIVIFLQLFW